MGEKTKASETKWSGRVLTSLCALASLVLLFVTGIILYVEPHGRVAYWTAWKLWGLEKDQWGAIHIFSGLLFLVAGAFHLYYNWKPIVRYISGKVGTGLRYKRELGISILVLLWIVVSGIWALPPLNTIMDVGENIKESWVTAPELEPPFGHAELVSLKTFTIKQRIPLDEAMKRLREAGFTVDSPKDTVQQIAATKNLAGIGVYEVIKDLEAKPEAIMAGETWTPEKIEEAFAGTGLGNKTIAVAIKDLNVEIDTAMQRLKDNGIEAKEDDKLKALADKNDTTPIKVMTIILTGQSS